MGPSRLHFVTKVLGQLFADEIGRAVGNRRRAPGDVEEQERQRARNVRLALERLGPFYIKVGQILSTRPDFIRPSLIDELKKLHDQVSVSPFLDFEPVLADGAGSGLEVALHGRADRDATRSRVTRAGLPGDLVGRDASCA